MSKANRPLNNNFESRLYDSLQDLNQASESATTIEELLKTSLDLMLDVFRCHRAWLFHPCDPAAPYFEVKMERTRPEWFGAFESNTKIPIDENMKLSLKNFLAQEVPLVSDTRTEEQFRTEMERFSVKSQLSTVIRTKIGKPWVLGIHYCEAHVDFSNEDIAIFSEFANRLGESLNYMLMLTEQDHTRDRYRLLIDSLDQGVVYQDVRGKVTDMNRAAEQILGVDKFQINQHVKIGSWFHPLNKNGSSLSQSQHPVTCAINLGKAIHEVTLGIVNLSTKVDHWITVNAIPQYDKESGELENIISTFSDITSLRTADEAMISHLRFLDSMERISRITVSANSVNDMLNDVLGEMLNIFQCSRTWFLFPCDPNAETWSIPLSRTLPEWPGVEIGVDMPISPQVSAVFSKVAGANGPVTFHANTDPAFASSSETIKFNVKSQMLIKLTPKVGLPWILGLHHCESTHHYSNEEKELFTEISRRIADSLNTLITLQNFKVSEARFRTLVEHAPEAIFVFNVDHNIFRDVNDNAVRLFKKSRDTLCLENFLSISPEFQSSSEASIELMQKYIVNAVEGGAPVFEWVFVDSNEENIACEVRLVRLPDAENVLIRCSITDITERLKTQEYLQHLAHHDALTDLPNRIMLVDRLEQAIVRAKRHNNIVAVLFVDIDHFKVINDTLGHDVGDKSLQKIAQIIHSHLRASDTVARFGGDEFVILLEEIQKQEEISLIVQKLLSTITVPMMLDDHEIFLSASIGISLYPDDADNVTTLLKYADVAMYRAKDRGRNTHEFYSSEMSIKAYERLTLETGLRRAVKQLEFEIAYQPQFDVYNNEIIGAEALLRWQPDGFDTISPKMFIPLLEETGLIVEVGEWVIGKALAMLKEIHSFNDQFKMSINLSCRQFQSCSLIQTLENAINKFQVDPEKIELEITESLLMEHHHITHAMLKRISDLGLHLSIDDFGTGYSSLSYLKQFPIDTLKIDRSFVRDIPTDPNDEAIVVAIIALAKSLKLKIIAEGVETEQQYQFMKQNHCEVAQGFYFSRPLSKRDLLDLLSEPVLIET